MNATDVQHAADQYEIDRLSAALALILSDPDNAAFIARVALRPKVTSETAE